MSPITSHVLDTALGRPASGLGLRLERRDNDNWSVLAERVTDDDGRVPDLLGSDALTPAVYRMTFFTGAYFEKVGTAGFYPQVEVMFEIRETDEHYHVPLLLSPFGYSTYRGS